MYTVQSSAPKKFTAYVATYGMWLGTAVLAVYEIALVRDIVLTVYTWAVLFSGRIPQARSSFEATTLGQGITIVMAILAIAIIIGGFEYYHKRVGEAKSMKILAWTLGIQIVVLVLGFVI